MPKKMPTPAATAASVAVGVALAASASAHILLTDRFGVAPAGPVQLLLTDHADIANGYATPLPYNQITTALVMHRTGTGREGASAALAQAGGVVARAAPERKD